MLNGLKDILVAYSRDHGLVVPLVIAVVVLMYSHLHIWFANRGRLADKDKHINDLITERDRLQDFLFERQGRRRATSKREEP
ncbi:MAG TPA: hypothetical protein VKB51_14575 [bacterium]|nr:hypothetical protein [bacterium]